MKGGLRQPAGFSFLPNGKLLYLERATGQVRILNLETKHDRRFFTIPGVNGERGTRRAGRGRASEVARPAATSTSTSPATPAANLRNQIVRIKAKRRRRASAMKVLLSTPASNDPYHNGGRIEFGPDGRLYAIVGDGHDSHRMPRTSPANLRGKILRLRADGGVPADNPTIGGERTAHLRLRHPELLRVHVRSRHRRPLGDRERSRVQRRGQPDRRRARTTAGARARAVPTRTRTARVLACPMLTYATRSASPVRCSATGAGCGLRGDLFYGACCDGGSLHRAVLNGRRDDFDSVVDVFDVPGGSIYSMETSARRPHLLQRRLGDLPAGACRVAAGSAYRSAAAGGTASKHHGYRPAQADHRDRAGHDAGAG